MRVLRLSPVLLLSLLAIGCQREESGPASDTPPAPDAAQTPDAAQAPSANTEISSAPTKTVELKPTQGNQASGQLSLAQEQGGVRITGRITGLKPNSEHGFHIHEKGDCSAPDASSAGDHFNPTSSQHGNPGADPHHAGDMYNLRADAQGNADVNALVEGVTLGVGGSNEIEGRAIVVHEKADDYKTQPSGNSGKRIACGVIQ